MACKSHHYLFLPNNNLFRQHCVPRVTVGTKISGSVILPGINSEKLQILLRDGPCLELMIVSSHFQALLLLQDKLLESV